MFLRGGSSRSNTVDESRRRFESSARTTNDFAGTSASAASAMIPEVVGPTASWGSQRFFRRNGSQPSLLRNRKKRLAQRVPKSNNSLSLSTTTSHTTSSPTTSNYSQSNRTPSLVSPGALLSSPSMSSSPAKKKQTRNLSDNSNSNLHDHHGVPRIIVAGPPLVGGGSNNGGNSNASNSTSSRGSAARRPAPATAASRPHIYVPHLDDTVSSFDGRGGKGNGSTAAAAAAAATPMDYCHHNSSNVTRRDPPPPPYVVSGPAPSPAPRRLPSDEDWAPSAASPRPHHPHHPSRRSDDEDTDIHDGETYNDQDEDDGRSASMCDTLHNSLGGNDSFRLPKLRPSTSMSTTPSGVFCCEDSYHNYSSSAGTDSFRLPNPYSVCDDSLHNSSSMGTDSHRRRHRHHHDEMEDNESYRDEGRLGQLHGDELTTTATQGSTTSGSARVVEQDQEEGQDDKAVGGDPEYDDNSDEVSLSPEEAVEVTHGSHATRSSADNSRASTTTTTTTTSATSANASRGSAGPRASDSLSASSIIEIFPGCRVPLRGCKDTWGSFRDGTAVLVPCAACLSCVYCVPDVTMVLCPHCRDISPLATTVDNRNSEASVGLGMSVHESRSLLGA